MKGNLLLDTAAVLYLTNDDPHLIDVATDAFLDAERTVFVSVVSFWEIG